MQKESRTSCFTTIKKTSNICSQQLFSGGCLFDGALTEPLILLHRNPINIDKMYPYSTFINLSQPMFIQVKFTTNKPESDSDSSDPNQTTNNLQKQKFESIPAASC